ncbi:MAG: hypothetical protein LBQ02_00415 [Candidatus Nomurabacteria bacterium]|nr:hypothetical protein [Candidatus Nomurabacteria bacterium]
MAIVLVGVLTVVLYRSLAPTEAAVSNITVINNNQTITTTQDTNITTITRTSEVNVTDTSATYGYSLTAQISANNLTGATVTIGSDTSSECSKATPCALSSTPTNILVTSNNNATNPDTGETTTFEVIVTIPSNSNIGSYTLDIAYDETPNSPPPIADLSQTCTSGYTATGQESAGLSTDNSAITVDLDQNMIPIIYTGNTSTPQWQTISPSDPNWYDYTTQKWANAITVTATSLSKYQNTSGVTVDEADVLGYWVYIPRYRYQVFRCHATDNNTNYRTQTPFNIQFENQTANNYEKAYPATNNDWATHPAFTAGSTELNGFWYGKFESSRSDNYYCYVYTSGDTCNTGATAEYIGTPLNTTSLYATIKPNRAPATYQRVSNEYLSAEYIKTAHNLNTQNTHMSTNNHWGATTYLSTSAYGIGDETYTSTNYKKTYNNGYYNSSASSNTNTAMRYQTGCGPVATHSDSYGATCNSYQTEIGQQASTTGNVYGIYDMAGGVYERQMAVYANPTGIPMSGYSASQNSGFTVGGNTTGKCYSGTAPNTTDCTITNPLAFPTAPSILQQYDVSTFTNTRNNGDGGATFGHYGNNNLCTFQTCGGQALHETKAAQSVSDNIQSWGGDYSYFVNTYSPWFVRGGSAVDGSYAGLFHSYYTYGYTYNGSGWRAVAGAY